MKAFAKFHKLRPEEVLVVCPIIDATSAELSITMSDKEVLSSRIFVYIVAFVQLLALRVALVAIIRSLSAETSATERCFATVWWTTFPPCKPRSFTILVYFAFRFISWLRHSLVAIRLAPSMDRLEKEVHLEEAEGPQAPYKRMQATKTLTYLQYLPIAIIDIACLELML